MKQVIFLIIITCLFINHTWAQALTKNGKITNDGNEYVNKNGAIGSANGVNVNGQVVPGATIPSVTTTAISAITSKTAASGVTVTSDGGATVTTGICWSTTANPTTELSSKTTDGTGSITGLTNETTYYVRAYATNSAGTGYGNELSFTTALAVGEAYQGGKIAYILKSGDAGYIEGETHGLIVSLNVLDYTNYWHYPVAYVGTTDDDGKTNTALIVDNENINDPNKSYLSAGEMCADYSVVGTDGVTYDDWFLPSKTELFSIKGQLSGPYQYWSSTEIVGTENAYIMSSNGTFSGYWKRNSSAVRAVRSF